LKKGGKCVKRVYANRFHVLQTQSPDNAAELIDQVIGEVEAWAVDVAVRRGVTTATAAGFRKKGGFAGGNSLLIEATRLEGSRALLYTLKIENGDEDPLVKWRTVVEVASASGNIEVLVTVHAGFTKPVLRPVTMPGSQPRIVRNLSQKFMCTINGQPVQAAAERLTGNSCHDFHEKILLNPERMHPIVVVTKGARGTYLVDPDRLAGQVVGLARVYAVEDNDFTFSLTDIIGSKLSVFDGGVRIYWPGFREQDPPRYHDLLLGYRILEMRNRGSQPAMLIAQRLYALVGSSFVESPTASTAKNLIASEKMAGAEKARTIPELQERIKNQQDEIAGLKDIIRGLEYQNQMLQESMWSVGQRREGQDEDDDFLEVCQDAKTADQILQAAEVHLGGLVIHENAKTKSQGVTSARLDELANALYILNEVAGKFGKDGKLGKPFKEVCLEVAQESGLKYGKIAISDSETAVTQFREERTIEVDGKEKTLEAHFTIAKAMPGDVLNVYFEPLPKQQKVLVGYVGRHLTNKGNR
jgi:hypothetical protein